MSLAVADDVNRPCSLVAMSDETRRRNGHRLGRLLQYDGDAAIHAAAQHSLGIGNIYLRSHGPRVGIFNGSHARHTSVELRPAQRIDLDDRMISALDKRNILVWDLDDDSHDVGFGDAQQGLL